MAKDCEVARTNTHSDMKETRPKAGGPANPTKHLPNQQVTPGQTDGMRVREAGPAK
jgi:hypothetical protein